jgi:hypothetical protein
MLLWFCFQPQLFSCYGIWCTILLAFVSAVTTVDSGTKALEFLGLHGEDASISVHTDHLVRNGFTCPNRVHHGSVLVLENGFWLIFGFAP